MDGRRMIFAAACTVALVIAVVAIAIGSCAGNGESTARIPSASTQPSQATSKTAKPADESQIAGYERLAALTEGQRRSFLEQAGRKFGTSGETVLTVESVPETGQVSTFYVKDMSGFHWHAECSDSMCAFARATQAEASGGTAQAPADISSAIPAQQDASTAPQQSSTFDWAGATTLSDPKAAKAAIGSAADGLYPAIADFMAGKGYAVTGESNVILPASSAKDASGRTAFTALVYSGNDQILVDVTYDGSTGAYSFELSK